MWTEIEQQPLADGRLKGKDDIASVQREKAQVVEEAGGPALIECNLCNFYWESVKIL
jgi:hypothetical protein